jgi:hypothetical protein
VDWCPAVMDGFFHVEGMIIAHTHFDKGTNGFTGRRELHVTGLPRPPTALAYVPRHHAEVGPTRPWQILLSTSS